MDSASSSHRNGKGRKKINMAKMDKKTNLLVTFSKRRSGLFKKASELSTMTGSEVAIAIKSPGNKVYSFGHPSVHQVMNKCFPEGAIQDNALVMYDERLAGSQRDATLEGLYKELSELDHNIEVQRNHAAKIDEAEKVELDWKLPTEEMTEAQLEEMGGHLLAFGDIVTRLRILANGMVTPDNPNPILDLGSLGLTPMGFPKVGSSSMNPMPDFIVGNPGSILMGFPEMGSSSMNPMAGSNVGNSGLITMGAPEIGSSRMSPMAGSNAGNPGSILMGVPEMGSSSMNPMVGSNVGNSGLIRMGVPEIGSSSMNPMVGSNVGNSGLIRMGVPEMGSRSMNPIFGSIVGNSGLIRMGVPEIGSSSMNPMPGSNVGNSGKNLIGVSVPNMENQGMNPGGVQDVANIGMNPTNDQVLDVGNTSMNPMEGFGYGSKV